MKSVKVLSCLLLALLIISSSCTVEKRVHRTGFHIEWNKKSSKKNSLATKDAKKESGISMESSEPATLEENEIKNIEVAEKSERTNTSEETVLASTEEKQIVLAKKSNTALYSNGSESSTVNNIIQKDLRKNLKTVAANANDDPGYSGMAIAGFICSLLGLILVLITGWPFLLGSLGVIFSAVGLGQTAKGKKGKGFAIAGLIIGILAIVIFWIWVAIIMSFFM